MLKEVVFSLYLAVPQEVFVGRREGGDKIGASGPSKLDVYVIVLEGLDQSGGRNAFDGGLNGRRE